MGTACRNDRTAEFGFSLIELLIVMVIIGLVVGIALPLFSGSLKKASIRTEAGKIVSVLKSARGKAIAQKKLISVLIDAHKRTAVQIEGKISTSAEMEELKSISPIQKISKEITILENGKELSRKIFEFYPTGGSSGGLLQVVPKGSDIKTIKNGYLIAVDIINGRAKSSPIVKKEE